MDILQSIKNNIDLILKEKAPSAQLILFGSRATGMASISSDYDFMVIVSDDTLLKERKIIAAEIRRSLAKIDIDADVIVKSKKSFEELKRFPGNVCRWADASGVPV